MRSILRNSKTLEVLRCLRRNARMRLVDIANNCGSAPSSTHGRIARVMWDVRLVSIPRYSMLGFPVHAWYFLSCDDSEMCRTFCVNHAQCNSVLFVHGDANIICEAIFTSFDEEQSFADGLLQYGEVQRFFVVDVVQQEMVFTH